MLNLDLIKLDYDDYKDNLYVDTLEYFYKVYLVERKLFSAYLPKFISIYFEYIQINFNAIEKLKESIIDLNTISESLQNFSISERDSSKLILKTFDVIKNNDFVVLSNPNQGKFCCWSYCRG